MKKFLIGGFNDNNDKKLFLETIRWAKGKSIDISEKMLDKIDFFTLDDDCIRGVWNMKIDENEYEKINYLLIIKHMIKEKEINKKNKKKDIFNYLKNIKGQTEQTLKNFWKEKNIYYADVKIILKNGKKLCKKCFQKNMKKFWK